MIKNIKLNESLFTGEIDFATLPVNLGLLGLRGNQFTGLVALTALPAGLRTFDVASNHFTGQLDLSALPPNMVHLNLSSNAFEGALVFHANLPSSLLYLGLYGNALSGIVDFSPIMEHKILTRCRYLSRTYGINLYKNHFTDWGPKNSKFGGRLPMGVLFT